MSDLLLEWARPHLALASAISAPPRDPSADEEVHAEAQSSQRSYLERARENLAEARRLVKQTEKPYEPYVPDWPDWEPPEYVGVFQPGEIVGYHCRDREVAALQAAIDHEN